MVLLAWGVALSERGKGIDAPIVGGKYGYRLAE